MDDNEQKNALLAFLTVIVSYVVGKDPVRWMVQWFRLRGENQQAETAQSIDVKKANAKITIETDNAAIKQLLLVLNTEREAHVAEIGRIETLLNQVIKKVEELQAENVECRELTAILKTKVEFLEDGQVAKQTTGGGSDTPMPPMR